MDDTMITVTIQVGTKWGHNDALREITVTCDDPDALLSAAQALGNTVMNAAYAATREYLGNLKSASEGEADNA